MYRPKNKKRLVHPKVHLNSFFGPCRLHLLFGQNMNESCLFSQPCTHTWAKGVATGEAVAASYRRSTEAAGEAAMTKTRRSGIGCLDDIGEDEI